MSNHVFDRWVFFTFFLHPHSNTFSRRKQRSELNALIERSRRTSIDSVDIDFVYLYQSYNYYDVDIHKPDSFSHFVEKILYIHHMIWHRNVCLENMSVTVQRGNSSIEATICLTGSTITTNNAI